MLSYGGSQIFGTIGTYSIGPRHEYRALRQWLPGIDGYRIYRLGRTHGGVWVCGGRLVYDSKALLEAALDTFGQMIDGRLRTFQTSGGLLYSNCQLVGFEPERAQMVYYEKTTPQATCVVRGLITRAAL